MDDKVNIEDCSHDRFSGGYQGGYQAICDGCGYALQYVLGWKARDETLRDARTKNEQLNTIEVTLKNCPFCDSDYIYRSVRSESQESSGKRFAFSCRECFAQTGWKRSQERAAECWNTRVDHADEREAELAKALERLFSVQNGGCGHGYECSCFDVAMANLKQAKNKEHK